MNLSRVMNVLSRPRWIATRITRLHAGVLRASGGRIRRSFLFAGGQPVLVLTTTGRKSGQPRATPVAYMQEGTDLVVVASNSGLESPPAWWLNLEAEPRARVEVDGEQREVRARRATPEEFERLWPKFVDRYSGFEQYQQLAHRDIPIGILEPHVSASH